MIIDGVTVDTNLSGYDIGSVLDCTYKKPDTRPLILKDNVKNVIARDITLERKPIKF